MDSFEKMHSWLHELRTNMPADVLIHIVGTTEFQEKVVDSEPRDLTFHRHKGGLGQGRCIQEAGGLQDFCTVCCLPLWPQRTRRARIVS